MTNEELQGILQEVIYTQSLLLEMISDIYEVAQQLGTKVGVGIVPSQQVAVWLKERGK